MFKLPQKLFDNYIVRRKEDVSTLKLAVSEKNIEILNRIGHQIKGNAKNFGLPQLEEVGEMMESLVMSDILTKGSELVMRFEKIINDAGSKN